MKKISKSEKIITNNSINSIVVKQKNHPNLNTTAARDQSSIKAKVAQSKPILESIYDKVRKKEMLYKQNIRQNEQKYQSLHKLTKQYKQFNRQALTIIHKNTIAQNRRESKKSVDEQKSFKRYQSLGNFNRQSNMVVKNILSQYCTVAQNQNKESQSVYKKYLRKLQENKQNKRSLNIKQEEGNTINKVRRLSKQIDEDLQELKLKKNKSSANMNCKVTQIKVNPIQKDRKAYFLQMQKRKLKLL